MAEQSADSAQVNLNFLDFEQPIAELEAKIEELRLVGHDSEINISEEIERICKQHGFKQRLHRLVVFGSREE